MLAELRNERVQIEEAILALQRLASGRGRRRGRPPSWMTAKTSAIASEDGQATRKRRSFGAATRAKMAASQRKRWAKKKETEAK